MESHNAIAADSDRSRDDHHSAEKNDECAEVLAKEAGEHSFKLGVEKRQKKSRTINAERRRSDRV